MRLTAEKLIIPILEPADHEAGADGDSFSMAFMGHATILLALGAITGNAVLKIYEGASAGTKTTSKAFRYKLSSADKGSASADQWGAEAVAVAADGLTLTATTYDHRIVAIDIAAEDLTDGLPWVTLELSAAASVLLAQAVAICDVLRYGAGQSAIGA